MLQNHLILQFEPPCFVILQYPCDISEEKKIHGSLIIHYIHIEADITVLQLKHMEGVYMLKLK